MCPGIGTYYLNRICGIIIFIWKSQIIFNFLWCYRFLLLFCHHHDNVLKLFNRSSALTCNFCFQTNASSGMGVAEQSKTTFLELQRKKVHRYVIFKIDEKKKEVVVEKTGGPAESYDDFTASLPENDCRYAVYDFDFVTSENCQKSKIFFIAWLVSFANAQFCVILWKAGCNCTHKTMFYALLS